MSKRSLIRIISYSVLFVSVLAIYSGLVTSHLSNYKKSLESNYQQSLVELNECLNTVETDLNKCLYSNSTGEIYDLSRDIYSQCSTAKNAISRLPISQMELQGTYKFLSQAGDYAIYIGNKLESYEKINDDDQTNIYNLSNYANEFANSTYDMIGIIESGGQITKNQVISNLNYDDNSVLNSSFELSENIFEGYPTLLYDGPFSDQRINKKSVFLDNREILPLEQCRQLVAKALDADIDNIGYSTDQMSIIDCYNFKYGRYFIAVTKSGGYIKSIINSSLVNESVISVESGIVKAKEFLNKIGYENMEESYYATNGNILTINFAYVIGDTYYYPDLIKVSVSLEDGSIIGLDASTFLMNHANRTDFEVKYTSKQAEECISKYLDIIELKKCVIPKDNGKEVGCWEFRCKSKTTGNDALIYINTDNLIEEEIELLLYSDNGILVK